MSEHRDIQLFRPVVTEKAIANVVETLKSGWIGLGPRTAEYEKALAAYLGAQYCVSVISGTAALQLALKLINISRGDEVITTPLTFVATNMVCLYEGAVPVFADIEPDTLNIDPDDIERRITDKTRAIIVVHFRGHPVDMDRINDIARRNDLHVIEDAAHAIGSEYRGQKIGSGNNICCGSTHAVKPMTTGEGGWLTVPDEQSYRRLMRLRWFGIDKDTFTRTQQDGAKWYSWRYYVNEVGLKCHFNDILASIGLAHLEVADQDWATRARLVALYDQLLRGTPGLEILATRDYCTKNSNHLFVIRVQNRNRLLMKLKGRGVNCGVHYYPNHLHPVYSGVRHDYLPVAERVWNELISLPLHLQLSEDDVKYVCAVIKEGW